MSNKPAQGSGSVKSKARSTKESFADYVKQHGEEQAVPFDDVLRRAVASPPKPKKGGGPKKDRRKAVSG
jgi:hypothetical protein